MSTAVTGASVRPAAPDEVTRDQHETAGSIPSGGMPVSLRRTQFGKAALASAVSLPGDHLRHDYAIHLDPDDGSSTFRADATFRVTS